MSSVFIFDIEGNMFEVRQLHELGVEPGRVLLVHCAFSKVKPVEGGPEGLIVALQTALGPRGTLVMPSWSDDDSIPFDPRVSSCRHLGVVADTFWRMPNVLRSDSPHAFAASGPYAEKITAPQPHDLPHGLDSPVGRVYELDGQVLLLGVDHDNNTTIHLAELLGGVRYRCQTDLVVMQNGQPTKITFGEINHCCQRFCLVNKWLDAQHLQRIGKIGNAESRLMNSRDVVRVVVDQLKQNETVFLHPFGVDEECDEARASLKLLD
jgi:aminoglycoside N3'-acetyltransferase